MPFLNLLSTRKLTQCLTKSNIRYLPRYSRINPLEEKVRAAVGNGPATFPQSGSSAKVNFIKPGPDRIVTSSTKSVDRKLMEVKLSNEMNMVPEEASSKKWNEKVAHFEEDHQSFLKTKRTVDEHHEHRKNVRYQRMIRQNTPHEKDTLLTWAAMDQIRQLHEQDPVTWTPEKISQSFPISVQGARNFIHGKKPKVVNFQKICEHDDLVEKRWQSLSGRGKSDVLDEDTKFLIKTGETKFMPLKAFRSTQQRNPDEDKFQIRLEANKLMSLPCDGPFMKMFRRHLRWKNSMKFDNNPEKIKSIDDIGLNKDDLLKPEEVLQSILYKNINKRKGQATINLDETDEDDGILMQFNDFRQKMKTKLKSSHNRVDRYYAKWIDEKHRDHAQNDK